MAIKIYLELRLVQKNKPIVKQRFFPTVLLKADVSKKYQPIWFRMDEGGGVAAPKCRFKAHSL